MNNISTKKATIIMVILGLTTIAYYNDVPFVAIGNAVLTDYAEATPGQANFILTGSSVIFAFTCLITGILCKKIGAKKVLMLGLIITALSGCGLALMHNVTFLIVMRIFMGIGAAFSNVAPYLIINSLFTSEKSRSSTVGIYDAFAGAAGFILSFVAGVICMQDWKRVAIIYAAVIPVMILVQILIPSDKALRGNAADDGDAVDEDIKPAQGKMRWGQFGFYVIPFVIMTTLCMTIYYYISVIFAEKGITNTAAPGTANALYLATSLIGSSTFGLYYQKLKHFLAPITMVLAILAGLLITISGNVVVLCIAAALTGIAYNVNFVYQLTYYPLVAPEKSEVIVSILTFIMGFMPFVGGYMITWFMALRGTDTVASTIPIFAAITIAGLVLALVQRNAVKKLEVGVVTQE